MTPADGKSAPLLTFRTRRGKVIVGSQCARVGCREEATGEISQRKIQRVLEEILAAIRGSGEEGPSSTGGALDGMKDRAVGLLAERAAEKVLETAREKLEDGRELELPIPWDLTPSLFCDACAAELLDAAGDDVADWYDAREEDRKWRT